MHPVFDNPAKWGSAGIWHPPSFNIKKFQKKLDRICGTSNGKPIVRLTWAWDAQTKDFYYTHWDAFGRGIKAEYRYKYRFMTIPLGDGDSMDIPPPRWILEQRYEPGQYGPVWEQSRWQTRNINDETRRFELRPAAPPDGWYGMLITIAEHEPDGSCCVRSIRERGAACWGLYREPAEKDLEMIAAAVRRRDADPQKWSPHEPLPMEAIAEIERSAFEEAEAADRNDRRQLDDVWHDFVYTHGWRAFEDRHASKRLQHGRYHFVNGLGEMKETESGLLIPSTQ